MTAAFQQFFISGAEMCNPQTWRTKGVYSFRRCSHLGLLPPAQPLPVLAAYFFTKGKEVFEALALPEVNHSPWELLKIPPAIMAIK